MKLEVLMSCMHQDDGSLIGRSRLTGDVLMINQCHQENYTEYKTAYGTARMISTRERGLTKSRNMAIANTRADVCLLCDDDELFVDGYEQAILQAYREIPQADVLIFKIADRPSPFPDRVIRLRFPRLMQVCSWQISFRPRKLLESGIFFDELLGAGTGNGAEEELKFLLDCARAGLKIYYTPVPIASVKQEHSTWYNGFTEEFFENRGATTRYILGAPLAVFYGIYYVIFKRPLYRSDIRSRAALAAILRGIRQNRISKAANAQKDAQPDKKEVQP